MVKVIIEVAIEPKNHTIVESKIKKEGEVLRNKNKKVRRNGVSLEDSSGRGNPGRRLSIDKERKGTRTKIGVDPGNPYAREIHLSKGGKNCSPAKRIIDFFNVNLD